MKIAFFSLVISSVMGFSLISIARADVDVYPTLKSVSCKSIFEHQETPQISSRRKADAGNKTEKFMIRVRRRYGQLATRQLFKVTHATVGEELTIHASNARREPLKLQIDIKGEPATADGYRFAELVIGGRRQDFLKFVCRAEL